MTIYKYQNYKFVGQYQVIEAHEKYYLARNIEHKYKECFLKVDLEHKVDDIYIYRQTIEPKRRGKYKKRKEK